jgi:hypothetical protein
VEEGSKDKVAASARAHGGQVLPFQVAREGLTVIGT